VSDPGAPVVRTTRAYDPPVPDDGHRVLVDRLWPRGVSRGRLEVAEWCREVAPSTELRRWFGHRVDRWDAFTERYRRELQGNGDVARLAAIAEAGTLTLVYGAADREHNQARVLAAVIEEAAVEGRR